MPIPRARLPHPAQQEFSLLYSLDDETVRVGDDQWEKIEHLLPGREGEGQPTVSRSGVLTVSHGNPVAGFAGAVQGRVVITHADRLILHQILQKIAVVYPSTEAAQQGPPLSDLDPPVK